MRWKFAGGLMSILGLAGIAVGSALFPSLKSIPNLDNVRGTSSACEVCHVGASGSAMLNPFGETVGAYLNASHQPDWSKIWAIDSDGDGYSNGEELGDPTGRWVPGTPDPGNPSSISHPGDRASKPAAPSSVHSVRTVTAWAVIKALFR